jgi:MFS family permease
VASLLLLFGGVGDRYGRRKALNIGLIGFALASAFGALATTSNAVIGARALLGVAGALIMPATLAYVRLLFPPREAKKAFAIWSGSSGLALALGPLAAGALIGPFGWTAVFWMDVPLALGLLVLAAFTIPASRNESAPRIDVLGALLSTAVLAPLMYGIIEGDDKGWMSSTVLGAFGVALLALAAFVAWERHTPHPMLNLDWFRARAFRMGAGLSVLGFTSVVGMLYVSVLFLQQYQLRGAFSTGAQLMPLGAGILVGASANNRIVARFGMRVPVIAGLLMLTGGSAVVAFDQSGYLPVAISLAIIGLGAGAFLPTLSEGVMNGAPNQAGGVAGATADAAVELGSALGIAVLGSVLSTGYDNRLPTSIDRLSATAHTAVTDSLYGAHAVAAKLPAAQGHALVHAANHAFLHGMSLAAMVAAGIALVTAVIAVRMPRRAAAVDSQDQGNGGPRTQRLRPATEPA